MKKARIRGRQALILVAAFASSLAPSGGIASSALQATVNSVVSGTLISSKGMPLRDVYVRLAAMGEPSAVPNNNSGFIGADTTDELGMFKIEIPARADLIQLARLDDGHLNMELFAFGFSQSASPQEGPFWTAVGQAVGSAGNAEIAARAVTGTLVELGGFAGGLAFSAPDPVTLKAVEVQGVSKFQVAVTRDNAQYTTEYAKNPGTQPGLIIPASHGGSCHYTDWYHIDTVEQYSPVGELHAYWDITGTFAYGRGSADSDIDVAYEYSNDENGWRVSGTIHEGETRNNGTAYSVTGGPYFGRTILSKFRYVKEANNVQCDAPPGSNKAPYEYGSFRIRETKWLGQAIPGGDVSYNDGPERFQFACDACVMPVYARGGASKHTSKSQEFGWSISLGPVTLGHRSGWSESVDIVWKAGSGTSRNHWLWGDIGPIAEARRVFSY